MEHDSLVSRADASGLLFGQSLIRLDSHLPQERPLLGLEANSHEGVEVSALRPFARLHDFRLARGQRSCAGLVGVLQVLAHQARCTVTVLAPKFSDLPHMSIFLEMPIFSSWQQHHCLR